jgi:putative ABC transport system permease protein
MSLWRIAWRSIQQRFLASFLTAFSMGLGVMLVVAVLVLYQVVQVAFHRGGEGYDLIVGPTKGSSLDLVLNNIFYIGQPKATLPYSVYSKLNDDGFLPGSVHTAVPICLGDRFKDQTVVGTNSKLLNEITYFGKSNYEFAEGNNFEDDKFFDAVLGANAAQRTGLKVGDEFTPSHDAAASAGGKADDHHRPFHVVGVLKPTGTPNDNVIFVNIEGFLRMGDHLQMALQQEAEAKNAADNVPAKPSDKPAAMDSAKAAAAAPDKAPGKGSEKVAGNAVQRPSAEEKHEDDHDHGHNDDEMIPDSAKRVSAVLVCTQDESKNRELANVINRGKEAQAALPAEEISRLLSTFIGNIEVVLLLFAVMIVIVAGIGILVSIYNSMNDRRHEIAIMRALGASRATVMLVILFESILLSLAGGAMGLALGHGLIYAAGPWIADKMNLPLSMLRGDIRELWIIPALIILASIVGYLPAVSAYRTDVGRALMANP